MKDWEIDGLEKNLEILFMVIPVKTGIQYY